MLYAKINQEFCDSKMYDKFFPNIPYAVDEINIGQSFTKVKIGNKYYNSINFFFYDEKGNPVNIYDTKKSTNIKVY